MVINFRARKISQDTQADPDNILIKKQIYTTFN